MRDFFNADEAAAELQRLTQTSWTAAQVLRAAKAGRVPACFDFVGEMVAHSVDGRLETGGASPRVLDFDGVVRSLTQPTADGIFGFGVLVEIQEAHRLKFSHKDGRRTRGIDLPTESEYGGRIKSGHKVECWIEDASVTPDAFLFHTDDLSKLATTTQAAPAPAQNAATPAPAVGGASNATETKEQRQDRRLQACIDAGLPMDTKAVLSRLPDGVGKVAHSEGVTRQAFSADVKAALERRAIARREATTVHRA